MPGVAPPADGTTASARGSGVCGAGCAGVGVCGVGCTGCCGVVGVGAGAGVGVVGATPPPFGVAVSGCPVPLEAPRRSAS